MVSRYCEFLIVPAGRHNKMWQQQQKEIIQLYSFFLWKSLLLEKHTFKHSLPHVCEDMKMKNLDGQVCNLIQGFIASHSLPCSHSGPGGHRGPVSFPWWLHRPAARRRAIRPPPVLLWRLVAMETERAHPEPLRLVGHKRDAAGGCGGRLGGGHGVPGEGAVCGAEQHHAAGSLPPLWPPSAWRLHFGSDVQR